MKITFVLKLQLQQHHHKDVGEFHLVLLNRMFSAIKDIRKW